MHKKLATVQVNVGSNVTSHGSAVTCSYVTFSAWDYTFASRLQGKFWLSASDFRPFVEKGETTVSKLDIVCNMERHFLLAMVLVFVPWETFKWSDRYIPSQQAMNRTSNRHTTGPDISEERSTGTHRRHTLKATVRMRLA